MLDFINTYYYPDNMKIILMGNYSLHTLRNWAYTAYNDYMDHENYNNNNIMMDLPKA